MDKSAELRPFLFTGPTLCKDKIRSGRALASLVPRQFSAARGRLGADERKRAVRLGLKSRG